MEKKNGSKVVEMVSYFAALGMMGLAVACAGGSPSMSAEAAAPKRPAPIVTPPGDEDEPAFEIGELNYGGTGCPAGTVESMSTPNGFFVVDTHAFAASENNGLARKACGIAIPIKVKAGYQVALLSLDTSGVTDLHGSSVATLRQEAFLSGEKGEVYTRNFSPEDNGAFSLDYGAITDIVWSGCGKDSILRTQTSRVVQARGSRRESLAAVERMILKVIAKPCE